MTTQTRRDYWLDKPDRFYRLFWGKFEEVQGQPILIEGWGELDCYLHRDMEEGWSVNDGVTGTVFRHPKGALGFATTEEAIVVAMECLNNGGRSEFLRWRDHWINQYGPSPRYAWADFEAGESFTLLGRVKDE